MVPSTDYKQGQRPAELNTRLRASAIERGDPLAVTQPEYATATLFVAGQDHPLADFGQVLKLKPTDGAALRDRSLLRVRMGDLDGGLADAPPPNLTASGGRGGGGTTTSTGPAAVKQRVVYDKVGRNDPCPCGSGKKYKKCHGA